MHSLGIAVVWCALQVTIVTVLATAVYFVVRRVGPAGRSLVAQSGLGVIVVLTALVVSPWPRWAFEPADGHAIERTPAAAKEFTAGEMPATEWPATIKTGESAAPTEDSDATIERGPNASSTDADDFAAHFWSAFTEQLRQQPVKPAALLAATPRWPVYLAGLFLAGGLIGLLRLFLGLLTVRAYRRTGHVVDDRKLIALTDQLRQELGCRRAVELRETSRLANAATVGWRRPIILLPAEWPAWSEVERRTVLAHELAHIVRNDFLGWFCAQIGLMLHFYHPLVHWLTRRLRLEQELACDAAAAAVAGGRESYLRVFAEMTLRQADRPASWPARTFLPTRTTLLRRIEMLRDGRKLKTTLSFGARLLTLGVIVAAGLFAAGFRGPGVEAAAPDGAVTTVPDAGGGFAADNQGVVTGIDAVKPVADTSAAGGLEYVPRDAMIVASIRPAALLAHPKLKHIGAMVAKQGWARKRFGMPLADIDRITTIILPGETAFDGLNIFILRTRKPFDVAGMSAAVAPGPQKRTYDGKVYYKSKREWRQLAYLPDNRTLVLSQSEPLLRRLIVAGKAGPGNAPWTKLWQDTKGSQFAVLGNMIRLRPVLEKIAGSLRTSKYPQLVPFGPFWRDAEVGVVSFTLGNDLTIRGRFKSENINDIGNVDTAIQTLIGMSRLSLDAGRREASKLRGPEGPPMLRSMDVADRLFDNVKIKRHGSTLVVESRVNAKDTATSAALLVPAIQAARDAARRQQSLKNLKQIGIAMHNYHEVHRHFPAAAVLGPDGKTTHSWRVALLPYLGQLKLYSEYRLNEPWDSEHNKKLLARMPDVFRHPGAKEDKTHTSYFVLTGKETVFPPDKSTGFRDITDGTSNTILAVEAVRPVPWTKPLDVPYSASQPLPKIGGHQRGVFSALLGDGSVRTLPTSIDEKMLRAMITRAGSELIQFP